MKLLFDQNLSPRLVDLLSDLYPNSAHVSLVELDRALDVALWNYASENGYTIVTKDADFDELSQARGYPPKIVWYGSATVLAAKSRACFAPGMQRLWPWTPILTPAF